MSLHVAVLGAGVTGVTAAYYLSQQGHRVTVIDRAGEAAAETSHANGSQLSYSYTDPLAQPSLLKLMPGAMLGSDRGIRMAMLGNFRLYDWGPAFLRECTAGRARENMLAVLDIALRSSQLLDELMESVELSFSWRKAGKLVLLSTEAEAVMARERCELKRAAGCDVDVLEPQEAIEREPTLADMQQEIAAAVYAPGDAVGDARAFSVGLAAWLQRERGVEFRFGTTIEGLHLTADRLQAVELGDDRLEVDAAVVSMGPWSTELLSRYGVRLPIYPIRGYSVTLPAGSRAPTVSITSVANRIVWSRLGDQVRIAGFADFVGMDTRGDAERVQQLVDVAERVAPQAADYRASQRHPWGGFRPVTPDSRPRVGRTRIPGLYINTGHGVLGWTLACATAESLAATVSADA